VGEYLSSALLDCYGSNVYQICMFLQKLPYVYERAHTKINIFMGPMMNINRALYEWKADNGEEFVIREVLEELARTGFAPMSDNKVARLLTKFNVCTFLTADAMEYQVPEGLRRSYSREGLIPASQLLRVLIAWKLMQMEVSGHSILD
jgi:hypothetical protein